VFSPLKLFRQVTDMNMTNFRVLLSAACIASILGCVTNVSAGPVRFDQVIEVVNARPGQAETGLFSRLKVANDYTFLVGDDDDETKKNAAPQDGRVITETRSDIVRDDVCDCEQPEHDRRGFPKWALLGLAAIPIAFIIIKHHNTPTPTPSIPVTGTPTSSPTPSTTPTGSPSMTPTSTPTPPMTPTPPPEPVPEPMTILLFGTGLASIGLAARRRFGKRDEENEEDK
jgi:hypothetical protein